jgi:hypothetical protein
VTIQASVAPDSYSKRARMSSFEGGFPLLAPLLGGVFRSGGSRYERSSMGSTTLSGNSCEVKY